MNLSEIIGLAFGLAMDAVAVSLGVGATRFGRSYRAAFRLSFHFGLFQFSMPVLGWYLGIKVKHYVVALDHWIAFFLLGFVGLKMIIAGFQNSSQESNVDPSRGTSLITLSLATSIDAFAVGITIAMINLNIWTPALIIGFVTSLLCWIAMRCACNIGFMLGNKAEILGGLILLGIGVKILISHLHPV
jgi:putative Mn2+ efflux pump MntP